MDGRKSSRGEDGKSFTEVLLAPLLVGIIAVALTAWFNGQQTERQNDLEDRRAEEARNIEEQRAQDAALQAYLDQMSVLILEKDLHDLEGEEGQSLYDTPRGDVSYTKTSTLARARTLSILDRVDPERKRTVLQFLYESALIGRVSPLEQDYSLVIVGLEGANLTDASLHNLYLGGVYLPGVDLSGADLSGASLDRATLDHTKLSNADLSGALLPQTDLTLANLKGADLSDAMLIGAGLSGP